jgi:hypothetical protein
MPPPPRRILRLGPWWLETAAPPVLLLPVYQHWAKVTRHRCRAHLIHYLNRYGPPGCDCAVPRDELPTGHYRRLSAVGTGLLDWARHQVHFGATPPPESPLARALRHALPLGPDADPGAYPLYPQEQATLRQMLRVLWRQGHLPDGQGAPVLLWCDRATGLTCKLRLGRGSPAALIPTAASERDELIGLLPVLGWGYRAAFALEGTRHTSFLLTAVQQLPPYQVWTVPIDVGSTLIQEGCQELRHLMHGIREARWPMLAPVLEAGGNLALPG